MVRKGEIWDEWRFPRASSSSSGETILIIYLKFSCYRVAVWIGDEAWMVPCSKSSMMLQIPKQ